jgi:hypothetical protein
MVEYELFRRSFFDECHCSADTVLRLTKASSRSVVVFWDSLFQTEAVARLHRTRQSGEYIMNGLILVMILVQSRYSEKNLSREGKYDILAEVKWRLGQVEWTERDGSQRE